MTTESHLWEEVGSEQIAEIWWDKTSHTCQLCNNCLEGELSEVHDQGLEHTAVDYFSFTIVQLIDTHGLAVRNLLHLHPVPSRQRETSGKLGRVTKQEDCRLTLSYMHPLPTHHHLLFAHFCSVHLSFLDANGAAIFPLPGIIKEHVSHQDCQFMHIQPGLQHKVTRVICQGHKHIHVLTNLRQERWGGEGRRGEGRVPSGQTSKCMKTTHT